MARGRSNARYCRHHAGATDNFVGAPGSAAAVPGKIAAIELAAIMQRFDGYAAHASAHA
jgi:hypothetical protein